MATNTICAHCGVRAGDGHNIACPNYVSQRNSDDMGMPSPVRREADKVEAVNHPAHYGGADNPYEAIKVIDAWGVCFCIGNTLKYLSRAGKKGGQSELQDLKKARWYLDYKISVLEKAGK